MNIIRISVFFFLVGILGIGGGTVKDQSVTLVCIIRVRLDPFMIRLKYSEQEKKTRQSAVLYIDLNLP